MPDLTELLTPIIHDLIPKLFCSILIVVVCWLLPMIASALDLHTGIKASKRLGVFETTSKGIRKTFKKISENMQWQIMVFILDLLLLILSTKIPFFEIPICSIALAIVIVVTEIKSMKENKRKSNVDGATSSDNLFKAVELIKAMGDTKAKAMIDAINLTSENKPK